jgi:hypothetical protein
MAKNKKPTYFAKINGNSPSATLNTENLFRDLSETVESPIDMYVKRNKSLMMKLGEFERAGLLDNEVEDDRHIYNLFLLGFISNVESYFRSIIREVIKRDIHAYNCCLEEPLTYAAAIHHESKFLPEALLEECTFISKKNIADSIKKFLGINLNSQEAESLELNSCLELFEQLCQLRHCIVHRAGLLGSKNAIKLGINEHKNYFEKPITLNIDFLQNASVICLNTVRTNNSLLFNRLVTRYIKSNKNISWDYRVDVKWFKPYYTLFVSVILDTEMLTSGQKAISSFEIYDEFRKIILTN